MGPEVNAVFNLSGDILSASIPAELVTGIPLFDNIVELLEWFCEFIERGFCVGKDDCRDLLNIKRIVIIPNIKIRIIIMRRLLRRIPFL